MSRQYYNIPQLWIAILAIKSGNVIAIREGRLTMIDHEFTKEEVDEVVAYS